MNSILSGYLGVICKLCHTKLREFEPLCHAIPSFFPKKKNFSCHPLPPEYDVIY